MIYIWLALTGLAVGNLGAMLGLGGGVFLLPILTIFFHMPIGRAVAASLVAVIATSSVASLRYLRDGLTNMGLALPLEVAMTAGAIVGGLVAGFVPSQHLALLFAVVALYTAGHMVLGREATPTAQVAGIAAGPQRRREWEALGGEYDDALAGGRVRYRPHHLGMGMGTGVFAGAISGLLGIGGGAVNVPVMVLVMGVPTRAAAATSNLMVGITAAASSWIYLRNGQLDPPATAVLALTVMAGAATGAKLSYRLKSRTLCTIFCVVLMALAGEMVMRALTGGL